MEEDPAARGDPGRLADGRVAADMPPPKDPDASERSVSRMTMRQVLLTGLEDVVQFDKKFTGTLKEALAFRPRRI